MHRSETAGEADCSACGASVASGRSREFEFGESLVLCFDCAIRRGGCYDDALDRWSEVPAIDDLGPPLD
jgi:hypothetical protein